MALVTNEMDILDIQNAERDLTPHAKAHPEDAEAQYLMGSIFNQKPRTPANLHTVLTYAQRAFPKMRSDERIYNLLGQLYLDGDQPQKALQIYLKSRQLFPASGVVVSGLLRTYTRLHDTTRAQQTATQLQIMTARHNRIDHLRHVLGFDSHNIQAALELARLREDDKDYGNAQKIYQFSCSKPPRSESSEGSHSLPGASAKVDCSAGTGSYAATMNAVQPCGCDTI